MSTFSSPEVWEAIGETVRYNSFARVGSLGHSFRTQLLGVDESAWEPELLSVIIAVSGNLDPIRTAACLTSIRSQQGVEVEIVLAEQTEGEPCQLDLAERFGAVHVVDHVSAEDTMGRFNAGRARNMGLAASRGHFVYFSDADVLLVEPGYLARIRDTLACHPELVLTRPPLAQLAIPEQLEVCRRYLADPTWPPAGVEQGMPFYWHFNSAGTPPPRLRMRSRGANYLVDVDCLSAAGGSRQALEKMKPRALRSCFHWGTIAARRSHLDAVAGYGECFFGWGFEDVDLLWKLGALYSVVSLERISEVQLVHLDHEHGWYDEHLKERNRLLHDRRKATGAFATILSDLLMNESAYAHELKTRTSLRIEPPPREVGATEVPELMVREDA